MMESRVGTGRDGTGLDEDRPPRDRIGTVGKGNGQQQGFRDREIQREKGT